MDLVNGEGGDAPSPLPLSLPPPPASHLLTSHSHHHHHHHHLPPTASQHQLSGSSRTWYEPVTTPSSLQQPTSASVSEADIEAYFKPSAAAAYFSQTMQGIGAYSVVSQGKTSRGSLHSDNAA